MPEVDVCTNTEDILKYQWLVRQVPVSEPVSRFAVMLVRATRPKEPGAPDLVRRYVNFGASVRATMFLTLAAKAKALMQGRYHVTPSDIASIALPVLRHRVLTNYHAESDRTTVDDVLRGVLEAVKP
jgi:MoxR-like ATPase